MSVGVVSAPLPKYLAFHTRVCRPVGLSDEDCAKLCAYAVERIGCGHDLKNISDLVRYQVPLPVPQRWRRRMIALGSGDPTRLICSTLIAQAFETVRYPMELFAGASVGSYLAPVDTMRDFERICVPVRQQSLCEGDAISPTNYMARDQDPNAPSDRP